MISNEVLMLAIIISITLILFVVILIVVKNSCKHKWKIVDKVQVHSDYGAIERWYHRYVLQCEKCGKVKFKDM